MVSVSGRPILAQPFARRLLLLALVAVALLLIISAFVAPQVFGSGHVQHIIPAFGATHAAPSLAHIKPMDTCSGAQVPC